MNKYIIVELIPTTSKKETGDIIQLSALKIDNLSLIDRFDYRLNEDKIYFKKILELIDYDKELFVYKNTTDEILNDFKEWFENYKILIIDNEYTKSYLKEFENKESIFDHLNMKYNDNIIDEIIEKYNLENSNYIVDLLYEALIYENNLTNK